MNLRFLALPAALAAVLALSGCANDNARYRADVYGPGSLNQAQAVKTVEILSVQTARIALPNETKNSAAQLAGTVAGCRGRHDSWQSIRSWSGLPSGCPHLRRYRGRHSW